ncbi:Fc.00g060040.m01.CDS01 [Cosmosporella sp. VM-42]
MPTEGVYVSPAGKKTFIPLENNPEVFTSLIHDLGVSKELEFHDVYSIDDADILGFIPRPALALIFISPPAMFHAVREADGTRSAKEGLTYDKCGDEEAAPWFLQTIGNACGLIALLHSVANGEARDFVVKDSVLSNLIEEVTPLKPDERAAVVYSSEALESAHMRAARRGDTTAPRAEEHVGHHFLAFVKGKDGHLWEMEGSSDGPIDRGLLKEDEDVLSEAALEKGVRRFLKLSDGELDFSIIALAKTSG